MKITKVTSNTFWKGEMCVRGIVEDEGNSYKVNLDIKGSQIRDYSCSCVDGNSYKGMCKHGELMWSTWKQQYKLETGKQVSTSQEVRTMIREYTNREVARITWEGEDAQIHVIPTLQVRGQELYLKFKIGHDRMVPLKDLIEFTKAVESGSYKEHGKTLGFYHSMDTFVPEDRPLVLFVMELVNTYMEHYDQFKKNSFVTLHGLEELNLGKSNRDRFFALFYGRELDFHNSTAGHYRVMVTTGVAELDIRILRAGRDGIRVCLDKILYGFTGEGHWYLGNEAQLYCLDKATTDALSVFLEQMMGTWGKKHEVEIQDRDVPLFYERVLQKILPYSHVDIQDVDLESYRPEELQARFEFDSSRQGEMSMKPTLSYGDFSFHPLEDDQVPRMVCRDVPGEFRISQLILKYFKHREDGSQNLVIRDDDDSLYGLLREGITEFMNLGEVYISERAKAIRMLPAPKIEVGVKTAGNWLNLTVDTEGLEREELLRILGEYHQKKPYYRLKSGEFLEMTDHGLMTVAQLIKGLAIPKSQLQSGEIQVPFYRALYLDSMLKDGAGITLYRDNLYKAVVRGMKSVADSDYAIPESLQPVLREYQKTGYRWLKTLDAYGFGGILADDMGLGKTIQMIAVLLEEKKKRQAENLPRVTSLIVCPASLIYNWENELNRFAPELKAQAVAGTAGEREEQLQAWNQYDVMITSYDLLKRDIFQYQNLEFCYQVIDEAQYIKNPNTQSAKAVKGINAKTRFALTGTPIENRLSELWSIFDYLMPGFLFSYLKFKKEYEQPIAKDGQEEAVQRLRRFIGPFVLRRLKQDVLKELPEKLETIVFSKAEGAQKELYTAQALLLKEQLSGEDGGISGQDKLQVLAQLTRLRQICCDPALCYGNYKGGSAKLDTCMELILGGIEGGHKILLFSQFTSMLERIAKRLTKEGIEHYTLTGSTSKEERIRMVGTFQTDTVPVFLISLKAGGTGLNLTAADIVIHYDPWWNVAAQNQATDRTHRIGQEKQVSVFQLIMKDTIEENIRMLQERKKDLAEQIITEGTLSLGSLTKDDLLEILGE